ncbi:hypothetical protein M1L60_16850 [Actinoplanes sp. TRM 88003]|uniref:DUF6745 domain-containing protein n=1 Tax=Paractinoplanes aksuensis TaxID=2939490 RepID=A0ABT1DN73_9ACTN|nr:hypothetical protein [Actinoplanes aksuensis]MCO8272264.1 hypothetical protein [Actinoplanes aksuensis]
MRLTDHQEATAAAIEDQWLAAALETAPANRPAAEEGVREAYRQAGLPEPEQIFWLSSPRAGAVAAALLSGTPPEGPTWVTEVLTALQQQGFSGPLNSTAARSSADADTSLLRPQPSKNTDAASTSARRLPPDESAGAATSHPSPVAGSSVRRQIRTEPWAAARERASQVLGVEGWSQLTAAAGRRSWSLVMDRVAGRLRQRLGDDLMADLPTTLGRAARSRLLDAIYGQHDGVWLATFEAADRLYPGAALLDNLTGLATVARNSGWWWATSRYAILTDRPTRIARDNVGRLHRGEGPALQFPDGYALWAWRGMPIPTDLAAELPTLTADRIGAEPNAELRRVMLEHFGYDRYLREAGAQSLHKDETGTLWHLPLPGDEPLVMVEVVNATPEPDGTSRIYWLRVPPTVRTAREGVAWTFGLEATDYHPKIQT